MTEDSRRVELSLPAAGEWLFLARTTGAAVASRWEFTYEEIADLRLAIDELCVQVVAEAGAAERAGAAPQRIDLVYSFGGGCLRVTATLRGADEMASEMASGPGASATAVPSAPSPAEVVGVAENGHAESSVGGPTEEELSQRILDALVDSHGTGAADGARSAWLEKSRSASAT